jgi:hypothetical protein
MRKRDLKRELERLARSDPESGRAALAKVTALRTLERLDRNRRGNGDAAWPTDDEGRFHPSSDAAWWDLDRADSDEVRERWRLAWLAERLDRM